jgi:O-antigen ligase
MKALVLNPIVLPIVLGILLIYSLITFELISQKAVAAKLEKPLILLLFVSVLPIPFVPFTLAYPDRLALSNLSFTGAATTFIIYAIALFFLKRICFPEFPKGILLVLKNPFLLTLVGLTVASSLWSETPLLTLRSSLAMVGVATLAAHVASRYHWQDIEQLLRWTLAIVGIVSVPIALFLPGIRSYGDPWGGFLSNSKTLGSLMALNAVLWLMHCLHQSQNKALATLMVIFSTILLQLTLAKSALVGFFILLYFALVLRLLQKLKYQQSIIVLIFSIIFSIFLSLSISAAIDLIFQALGKDPTLTGRTIFWQQLVETIFSHPIGYGYNGFWQPWRGTSDPSAFIGAGSAQLGNYRPPHAHNGFLEIGLQLGFIGLCIFLVSFAVTTGKAIWQAKTYKGTQALFPLILLVYLVISNLGETEILGLIGPNHTWFLYAMIATKVKV